MNAEPGGKVLITGATSFVGRHLVRALLAKGWQVHALMRPKPSPRWSLATEGLTWHMYDGSIESVQAAVECRPCVAFHLASLFRVDHQPGEIGALVEANVLLGTQLAEALIDVGCQNLVNTGTAWQHFQGRAYDPVNLYAATKQALQDILEYYVQAKRMRVVTLKLFDTFGPDDDRGKILHLLQRTAEQGGELALSPGEQQLNMVYIDDISAAFILAAERLLQGLVGGFECYSVPAAEAVSLRQLVAMVQEVLGRPLAVKWGARPYRPREVMNPWTGSPLPGWVCRISLKEGLRRTLTLGPHESATALLHLRTGI